MPEGVRKIEAAEELECNPFKDIGYMKPTDVKNFKFSPQSCEGFGEAEPAFIRVGL